MAWKMQIRAERSWNTTSEEDQVGSSPSTPEDYAKMSQYLEHHVKLVMESLASLTIDDTLNPISPKMPSDHRALLNPALCQRNLTWDHLPDDVWTDNVEKWLFETEQATEAESVLTISASETSISSFQDRRQNREPLSIDVHFTDIQWQRANEEYSLSIYSKNSSAISPKHPHKPAPLIIKMGLSPTNFIAMDEILNLASRTADVCTELRATINRAEDSAEFDETTENDSNSDVTILGLNFDVSMLDLDSHGSDSDVSMQDLAPRTFYDLARNRGLIIASDRSSSCSGSHQSSIDRQHYSSNVLSPSQLTGNSNSISHDRHRGIYRNNGPSHSWFSNSTASTVESSHQMDIDHHEMDIDAHRQRYDRHTSARSSSTASSSESSHGYYMRPPPQPRRRSNPP